MQLQYSSSTPGCNCQLPAVDLTGKHGKARQGKACKLPSKEKLDPNQTALSNPIAGRDSMPPTSQHAPCRSYPQQLTVRCLFFPCTSTPEPTLSSACHCFVALLLPSVGLNGGPWKAEREERSRLSLPAIVGRRLVSGCRPRPSRSNAGGNGMPRSRSVCWSWNWSWNWHWLAGWLAGWHFGLSHFSYTPRSCLRGSASRPLFFCFGSHCSLTQ